MDVEVFNPHGKPIEELPTIYGFNNGGNPEWLHAQLIDERGYLMGSHICSNECFMPGDLGILKGTRKDRHEGFRKIYPDGYKMEFVGYDNIKSHEGLQKAIENNKNLTEDCPMPENNTPEIVVTVVDDKGNESELTIK